jgi:hypothetical protein
VKPTDLSGPNARTLAAMLRLHQRGDAVDLIVVWDAVKGNGVRATDLLDMTEAADVYGLVIVKDVEDTLLDAQRRALVDSIGHALRIAAADRAVDLRERCRDVAAELMKVAEAARL